MDWECYKRLCDEPRFWSRWMLEQTLELLNEDEVSKSIRDTMKHKPLAKPDDHRGSGATDMFELMLTQSEVARACGLVIGAIAEGKTTSGTEGRGLKGFREAWEEYGRFLGDPIP